MPRQYQVVYRWCAEHEHVEKGRRFPDGHVEIVAPPALVEAHKEAK